MILPLASLDTLASLQILESVKIAGDDYRTTPSLLMNGLGTLAAAALGSPFPTTLYVGHAAHKGNGARSGYSALNGVVTLVLCTTGLLPLVLRVVPLEVAGPVIVWFGLVTVGQAFVEVPRVQSIAVALGLVPMLAQWAVGIADTVARKAGSSLAEIVPRMGTELALAGLLALGQGALLTSMLWAAVMALVIERKFVQAAGWFSGCAAGGFRSHSRIYAHDRGNGGPHRMGNCARVRAVVCGGDSLPALARLVCTQAAAELSPLNDGLRYFRTRRQPG